MACKAVSDRAALSTEAEFGTQEAATATPNSVTAPAPAPAPNHGPNSEPEQMPEPRPKYECATMSACAEMSNDFFLSHYQATGGDQVMSLELRLSVTGFS